MTRHKIALRRGSILPLLGVALVALFGFVALAIDMGRLSVAKVQCQSAADAAAIAGARTIDGTGASSTSLATSNAQAAALAHQIFSQSITASEVTITHGTYHYDDATQKFVPQFTVTAPDNYNLTQVVIRHVVTPSFCGIFGHSLATVSATATAAHRPRDVAIVLDYSGSMNNESDLWNNEGYLGAANNSPNNTDSVFPQFGPYDPSFSSNVNLQCTSTDSRVGKCNVTVPVLGISAMVDDFYQNAAGTGSAAAFTAVGGTVTNTSPGGDRYLMKSLTSTTVAVNWAQIVGSTTTKSFSGYSTYTGSAFRGYTQAAGYWGKTFFIWPPDVGAANDWRQKFFMNTSTTAGIASNLKLWNSSDGTWLDPSNNYRINYKAILDWIKNTGPNPFPARLRAARVLFYDSIPTDVPAAAYTHSNANSSITDANQRFWKEYIDYVIGVWRDPFGNIQHPGSPSCSIAPDFICSSSGSSSIKITGPDAAMTNGTSFIGPADNPQRPRHRFWFGPLTMIQFLSDTGLLPGTAHDISMVAAKLGIAGALQDIHSNHPNDMVALIMFSRPAYSGDPAAASQFSVPRVSLCNDYTTLINAMWYPPGTGDVRPWDANDQQTPRAHGDYCSNTATDYGLMLAYNQFSGNSTLRAPGMGGYGRKGAQKIVILETDGMANYSTNASTTNAGAYQSYYNVGPLGAYSGSGSGADASAVAVAQRICALETDTSGLPGYAQPRKPVQIHCIAFGAIFEPTAAGTSDQTTSVTFLQQLSTIGGTTFPGSSSDATNGYKWCIGTLSQRQTKLQQAFTKILDETVSIVLVK